MAIIDTTVSHLLPGDRVLAVNPPLVVASVEVLGGLTIVDLTDGTATAPMPSAAAVRVERA